MNLLQAPLFRGLDRAELEEMHTCGCMRRALYEKNQVILHAGDTVRELGIVASGRVNIESVDLWGNKSLLSDVPAGQVFAESYAWCGEPLMVDAVAAQDSEIFFLELSALNTCPHAAPWRDTLMRNLLSISVRKNLALTGRSFCTAPKSVRGRLLTYLSAQAVRAGSPSFQIPFDRQQMADYLNLDRSALSKELGRMRDEGLLSFRKNCFTLKAQTSK